MGCAKHYALNSIEETRTKVDVRVDERTLREVYLPHFKRLAEANVASFMSAYNKVNGDYCGESRHLLREILKEEWGYRGFVMSDFFKGVYDGKKAALAGLDLEMPWTRAYGKTLVAAVEKGEVPLAVIDEAVLRLLRRKIEYATRPDPMAYPASLVRAPEHAALAREVAEKGTVLLKNEGGLLPLDEAALRSVAVLGRLADAPNLGDYGSSRVYPPDTVTVVEGLREALGAGRVVHEPGSDLAKARAAAKAASAVVVVAGFDQSDEGEYIPEKPNKEEWGGDREDLALKAVDRELILAAAAENPRTIVVLIGASAITVEEWHEKAGAILMAFYPGEQGGAALARLLLGRASPSGKLPFTVPKDASLLPPFDNKALTVEYGYYHGYTLAEKKGWEPRYPFGHGLSYTTFAYSNLSLDAKEASAEGAVHASVDVTNTGSRAGEEIAQLYVGLPVLEGRPPGEAPARVRESAARPWRDEADRLHRPGEGPRLLRRRHEGVGRRANGVPGLRRPVLSAGRPLGHELQGPGIAVRRVPPGRAPQRYSRCRIGARSSPPSTATAATGRRAGTPIRKTLIIPRAKMRPPPPCAGMWSIRIPGCGLAMAHLARPAR